MARTLRMMDLRRSCERVAPLDVSSRRESISPIRYCSNTRHEEIRKGERHVLRPGGESYSDVVSSNRESISPTRYQHPTSPQGYRATSLKRKRTHLRTKQWDHAQDPVGVLRGKAFSYVRGNSPDQIDEFRDPISWLAEANSPLPAENLFKFQA